MKQICDNCDAAEAAYTVTVKDMDGNFLDTAILCTRCFDMALLSEPFVSDRLQHYRRRLSQGGGG